MWAIAHPLRLHMLELLADGPSTASRLARRVGESRSVASYHLRRLARAGVIVEATELGNRRERWWRRREPVLLIPSPADPEGRAISARMFAIVFARDEEARRRFTTREVDPAWHEAAHVGSWFVELTPDEASDLGRRFLDLVRAARLRTHASTETSRALVSISVLPWLE